MLIAKFPLNFYWKRQQLQFLIKIPEKILKKEIIDEANFGQLALKLQNSSRFRMLKIFTGKIVFKSKI